MAIAGITMPALLSCGDGTVEPAPRPAPVATTVTVNPASAALSALGETARFTVEVRDQNGQVMAGASVAWTSSDASVASVDDSGLVTATANGDATITATTGSVSGTAAVTVEQVVTAVVVSPMAETLVAYGDTVRLMAEANDANGHVVADSEFSWSSSDTMVARVDDSGLVESVAEGKATVTATASDVTGQAELAVVPVLPTSIVVSPDTVRFTALGQMAQLAADVRDQAGRVMAEASVSWSSGDTAVAAVDSVGLVTATGTGTTAVMAAAGDAVGEAAAMVIQLAGSVLVTPPATTIELGDTLRLAAEAFDENGYRVDGAVFSWTSSDAAVATVDGSGLVTGVAEGAAEITAMTDAASSNAEVTVENPDRAALVALYEATSGPNWLNSDGWLTDAPLGEWYGVETDASGRVIGLDLGGGVRERIDHGLAGPLPGELGDLDRLVRLELGWNSLSGVIPPELGRLSSLEVLDLNDNSVMRSEIPPELGNLANLRVLKLTHLQLEGQIPAELGNTDLRHLDLRSAALTTGLTGELPPELGNLTNLAILDISGRQHSISGSIPSTFLRLRHLDEFSVSGRELCVPGTRSFVEWSEGIRVFDPLYCNERDIAALEALHQKTDGPNWLADDNWLANPAVEEWYGVEADSLGRVVTLDLADNGLHGTMPGGGFGQLGSLVELRVEGNPLSGPLPLDLSRLPLKVFHYSRTELCAPADPGFRAWLTAIPSHEGTGAECSLPSDREILEALYYATGGPTWRNSDNWLGEAPLADWYGVNARGGTVTGLLLWNNDLVGELPPDLGHLADLENLFLQNNDLTGPVPAELGNLASLQQLALYGNDLSGPIPPELGNLVKLERLDLRINDLAGPIPPELGNLASLQHLDLHSNDLAGNIPAEIGNLANLGYLELYNTNLTGSIPPELGNLANLRFLSLYGNDLAGPIPPELGSLARLRELYLGENELTGSVPPELGELGRLEVLWMGRNDLDGSLRPELGGMSSLRKMVLSHNPRLSGPIPVAWTALTNLESLEAGGTDLCAPADPSLQSWLGGVYLQRIASCTDDRASAAYLVQAVQSREHPVPLVAGRRALLRVFVTAARETTQTMPAVRARFFLNGAETHVARISPSTVPIPNEIDEGALSASANAEIPGWVMQPGLEMLIDVDPQGSLDPSLHVAKRIPAEGRLAVDVREMPSFNLTLIPFIWSERPDSSIVSVINAMAADPEHHELLEETRTLLPVNGLTVRAHAPVASSSNNGFVLLRQAGAIRVMEGRQGHYMAMMSGSVTGPLGVARLPGWSSYATHHRGSVIAHELGHNLHLVHAPCGVLGDPAYPYEDGLAGAWGYDFNRGILTDPAIHRDVMSYCAPHWISDYSFANALRFRLSDAHDVTLPDPPPPTRSLLLWGGVDAEGDPFLEPTFVVDAPAALPDSAGEYRLAGWSPDSGKLFDFTFPMPDLADGDGSSSFAFALPVQPGWERLASITLIGPGGSVTLDQDSSRPMAILRDPRTGEVRGFLVDPPPPAQAAAEAGQFGFPALEVLFSRGIPDADAWRR